MRTRETIVTAGAVVLLFRYWRRTVSSAVALLVLGVLAGLVPLAHASLPDPTWIAGFYDDADIDVILAIVSVDVAASPTPLALARPEAGGHRLVRARPLVRDHCPCLTANRSPPLPAA